MSFSCSWRHCYDENNCGPVSHCDLWSDKRRSSSRGERPLSRMINARTILVVSNRSSNTTVLIVPTNMIRSRTRFVAMTNNSHGQGCFEYDNHQLLVQGTSHQLLVQGTRHQLLVQGTSNGCCWAVVARTNVDVKPFLLWGSKAKVRTIEILENTMQSIDLYLDCCC